jgi:hypothetical protein
MRDKLPKQLTRLTLGWTQLVLPMGNLDRVMKKDSLIILFFSVSMTVAVVGGAYYLTIVRNTQARPTVNDAVGEVKDFPQASNYRTNTPIKCHDPEVGEFWTNASSCDGADLNNRMSYATPLATSPAQDKYTQKNYKKPEQIAVNSRTDQKPDFRRKAKESPKGIPAECRFPVGEAAELERSMGVKDDPKDSIWAEKYCEWRREIGKLRCPIPNDFFYYSISTVCGNS